MMEDLLTTQSASDFIDDVNANLQEVGFEAEVSVDDSATELVSTLNTAFSGVTGAETLHEDDSAVDFVSGLNSNFGLAEGSESEVDAEVADSLAKLKSVHNSGDTVLMLSTDLHHEVSLKKTFIVDGVQYDDVETRLIPAKSGQWPHHSDQISKWIDTDTLTPLIDHQAQLISLAQEEGINTDAVVCLGDFFEGERFNRDAQGLSTDDSSYAISAKEIIRSYVANILSKFKGLGKPLLFAVGNHDNNRGDWNVAPYLTEEECSEIYLQGSVGELIGDNNIVWETSRYCDYYKDINGIRFVVLYCNNNGSLGVNMTRVSYTFLTSSVADAKSNGKKVVVLCHFIPQHSVAAGAVYAENVLNYLEAESGTIIAYLAGHEHVDYVIGAGVPMVVTTCNRVYSGNHGYDGKDLWEAVNIDTVNSKISLIRFNGEQQVSWTHGGETHTAQSNMDRVVNYLQPIKSDGESHTFTAMPNSGEDVSWGMNAESSVYKDGNSFSSDSSSDFAEISTEGNSCTLTVKAQHQSRIQHIVVYANYSVNGALQRTEYWFVKIPVSS